MDENISNIDDIILSFLKGEISDAEKKILEEWINSDLSNKEYFKDIYRTWEAASSLNDEDVETALTKLRNKLPSESERELHPKRPEIFIRFLKIAAIVVFAFISGALVIKYSDRNKGVILPYGNEITVPLGSISTVRLPDGTEVILNAGSKLTYKADYGTVSREVSLTGEGYFKVHKNKDIPFVVKTLKAEIKALGTEFNVKAYPEEEITETVLVEGSVVVRKLFAGNEESQKSNETVTLKPGQKVKIYKETKESDSPKETKLLTEKTEEQTSAIEAAPEMIIQKTELEVETSWKDKEWIVKAVPLEDLAVLLSRKFNVSIEVKSPELKKYMFSGTIENETVEQVFNIMKYTIPVSYSIDKGKVIWTIDHSLERDYKEAY